MTQRHEDWLDELRRKHPEKVAEVFALGDRRRALGAALWTAFKRWGGSKADLARRMGTSIAAVNRLFDAGNAGTCSATTLFKFEIATGEKVFAHELPDDRQALDLMIAAVEKIAGEEDGADRMMAMLRDLVQSMAREVAGTVAREACAEVRAELQRNPPVFDPLPRPSATGTWRPVVVRGGQDQEVA